MSFVCLDFTTTYGYEVTGHILRNVSELGNGSDPNLLKSTVP